MYRLLKCSTDAYITNRIIDNKFRATDANTGLAGTLDLFKLFDESTISGTDQPIELSRLLVKFDLDSLRALTGSVLDLSATTFKVTLRLKDIVGGHPVPSDFTVNIHPLSKSFDEGVGRDVGRYSDLDVVNWVTASVVDGVVIPWDLAGAGASGGLGASDIDIISSGNLLDGNGVVDIFKSQVFTTGDEDLEADVTKIVSATLVGTLPDKGFRVAFTDAIENGSASLFVKRFASRGVTNPRLRPALIVQYDDSFRDNHANFVFDTSGSLFLFNTVRNQPKNLISGAAGTELIGTDALTLKLISGAIAPPASSSFSASYSVDQFSYGSNFVTGVYVASFALSSFDTNLQREIASAGSGTFTTVWGSNDGTVAFRTGSIVVRSPFASSYIAGARQLSATVPGIRVSYKTIEEPRIRVNVFDLAPENALLFSKLPLERTSQVFEKMYWRVVDVYSGEIVIPFDTTNDSTRMSTDSRGMFFDFFPGDLTLGRVYSFEFLIKDNDEDIIINENLPSFRIMP